MKSSCCETFSVSPVVRAEDTPIDLTHTLLDFPLSGDRLHPSAGPHLPTPDATAAHGQTSIALRELLVKTCDEMEQGMPQAISQTSQLFSSHRKLQTILSCSQQSKRVQIRRMSRCRLCWRLVRLKINVRWCVVHIRKSHICANLVDMQKTNSRFAQQHRRRNHFIRCWSAYGTHSRIGFVGFSY